MTIISQDGNYEWDDKKNKLNIIKHGISFEEAITSFEDPNRLERYDAEHSLTEDRFICIGCTKNAVVIITCYVARFRTRIISARFASKKEEKMFYECTKDTRRKS